MDISAYLASVQDNPQSAALAHNITQPGIPSPSGETAPGTNGSWASAAQQNTGPVTGGFDQTQMGTSAGMSAPSSTGFADQNLSGGMHSAQDYTQGGVEQYAGGGSIAMLEHLAATIPIIKVSGGIGRGANSSSKPPKDEPPKHPPNNPGPRKKPEEEALRHNQKQNAKDIKNDDGKRPSDKEEEEGEKATDGDHNPDGSEGGGIADGADPFQDFGMGGDEFWGNHGLADSGEYDGSTYGGDYDTGYNNPGAVQDYGGFGGGNDVAAGGGYDLGGGDMGAAGGGDDVGAGYDGGYGDGGFGSGVSEGGGFDVGGFGGDMGGGEFAEGGEVGDDADNASDDKYARLPRADENIDDRRRDVLTPQEYAAMSAAEQAMVSNYPGGPGDDMLAGSKRIMKGPQRYAGGGAVGGADVRTAVAAAMDYGYKKHAVNPGVPDPMQGQRVKEMLSNRDATPPHQAHAAIAAAGGNSGQAVADVYNFYNKQGRGQPPKRLEEGGDPGEVPVEPEFGMPPPVENTERGEDMSGEMDAEPKGLRERIGDAIGMRGPEVQAPPAIPPQEDSEPPAAPTKRKGGMEALGGLGLSETGAQEGGGGLMDAVGNGAAAAWGMVRAIGETWNKASALARAANDQGNPPKAAEIMGHALTEGVPDGEKVHVTAGPDGYKVNTSDGGTMTLTPQQFDQVAKTPFDVIAHQGVSHALQKVAEVPTSVNMQQAEAVRGRMAQQDQGQPQPQRSQAAQALARANPQRGQWPDGAPFGGQQQGQPRGGNNEPIRILDGRTMQPTPMNGGAGAPGRTPQQQGNGGPIRVIDGRTGQPSAIYDPDKYGAMRARPMVSERERMGQATNRMHENVARMGVQSRENIANATAQARTGQEQIRQQGLNTRAADGAASPHGREAQLKMQRERQALTAANAELKEAADAGKPADRAAVYKKYGLEHLTQGGGQAPAGATPKDGEVRVINGRKMRADVQKGGWVPAE